MPYEDLTGTVVRKICMACSREFGQSIMSCPHDGNLLVELPQDQWVGKRLADRFVIKKKLGTGGMGEVYLAWHELMEKWVAIKMLKQSFVEDMTSVQRFQREAKAASRLKHPNVITLHDFGLTDTRQPYMVMDFLVGYDDKHPAMSLAQLIKKQQSEKNGLAVETVIHVISQACNALDHAHRQGVIHRDIKPANIMIVPTDEDPYSVKVVDFGVAKLLPINQIGEEQQGLTQIGEICGSPVYMSPEQCMGEALDSRADIYSMGIVLYEALTGKLPLLGKNMVETMQKHQSEIPRPLRAVRPDLFIPEKLEQVVLRALSKEPHDRHQTMAELSQDLQFSIPRPGQTPNLKVHELLPAPEAEETKMPWLWPAVGGGVVASLAILLFLAIQFSHPGTKPASQPVTATGSSQHSGGPAGAAGVSSTGTETGTTTSLGRQGSSGITDPSPAGSPATTGGTTAGVNTPPPANDQYNVPAVTTTPPATSGTPASHSKSHTVTASTQAPPHTTKSDFDLDSPQVTQRMEGLRKLKTHQD